MTVEKTPALWIRMRAYADKLEASPGSAGEADHLRKMADTFETACNGYFGEPQTVGARQFLGAWARARRLYCDVTGEPLV